MRRLAAVALLTVTVVTSACSTPRWSGEPALRDVAQSEQTRLLERVTAYEDSALTEYLGRLGQRLSRRFPPIPYIADSRLVETPGGEAAPSEAGTARHHDLSIHVLRDPTLAVFALPTGVLIVHTGLLAAVDNEAQLAAALGHALAHDDERHALEAGQPEAVKPRLDGEASTSRTAAAIFALGLPLTARAAITGYGRWREWAADAVAVSKMQWAGWDPREAPAMFNRLADWSREAGSREIFAFGDQRWLAARAKWTRWLLRPMFEQPQTAFGIRNSKEFERLLRPVVRDNAYEDIRQGRFTLARRQLDRAAAATPEDPRVHLYYGELYRLQAQRASAPAERDVELVEARAAYERALALDPALAEAHRALGLLYYAMHDLARARGELERYLALAPSAPDGPRIAEYVQELAR